MSERILLVDDDPHVLTLYQTALQKRFVFDSASTGERALNYLTRHGPYAVLVADLHMPGMSGLELLAFAMKRSPKTVRIVLTGDSDPKVAIEAVNAAHIFQFLNKPFPPHALLAAVESAAEHYRLANAERQLLQETLNGSVKMLTELLGVAEPEIVNRSMKIRDYAVEVAASLGLTETWEVEVGAMLCNIGYLTIPPPVMQKVRGRIPLNVVEREMVSRVPETGRALLAAIPRLESVANIVRYQNKNFDGSGFPEDALAHQDIPIGARILKVVSELIELENYGVTKAKIVEQMHARSGRFDRRVVDAAMACLVYAPPRGSKPLSMKDLQVGQTLMAAIETKDGTLLVAAGSRM